jgi:hypothetical protein
MSTVTTLMIKICDENKDDPEVLNWEQSLFQQNLILTNGITVLTL